MGRKKPGVTLPIAFIVLAAVAAWSADDPPPKDDPSPAKEEIIRDRAIAKLAAWRAGSAENILDKELKFDKTQAWLTAEGLFLATTGLGSDDAKLKRGLEILDKQSKRSPEDPVSAFYLGEVLKWADESDKARAAWGKARDRAKALIEADPKNATAQFYLGASLVRLKQGEQARNALKKIGKNDFDPAMVEYQIGLTYMLDENWTAARDSFDQVAKLDPRYAYLYFYRGFAWDKLGRKDKLVNDLDQCVKLAPNSPEANTARAILSSVK